MPLRFGSSYSKESKSDIIPKRQCCPYSHAPRPTPLQTRTIRFLTLHRLQQTSRSVKKVKPSITRITILNGARLMSGLGIGSTRSTSLPWFGGKNFQRFRKLLRKPTVPDGVMIAVIPCSPTAHTTISGRHSYCENSPYSIWCSQHCHTWGHRVSFDVLLYHGVHTATTMCSVAVILLTLQKRNRRASTILRC